MYWWYGLLSWSCVRQGFGCFDGMFVTPLVLRIFYDKSRDLMDGCSSAIFNFLRKKPCRPSIVGKNADKT